MKSVGERIRQAREALKMSGEELARKVGYKNQSAIGNLENRAGGLGGQKLGAIATALNVSVDWLLNGPDGPNVPFLPPKVVFYAQPSGGQLSVNDNTPDELEFDPVIREAVTLLRSMSVAGRGEAIKYLRYMTSQHSSEPSQAGKQRHTVPESKAA